MRVSLWCIQNDGYTCLVEVTFLIWSHARVCYDYLQKRFPLFNFSTFNIAGNAGQQPSNRKEKYSVCILHWSLIMHGIITWEGKPHGRRTWIIWSKIGRWCNHTNMNMQGVPYNLAISEERIERVALRLIAASPNACDNRQRQTIFSSTHVWDLLRFPCKTWSDSKSAQ